MRIVYNYEVVVMRVNETFVNVVIVYSREEITFYIIFYGYCNTNGN